MKFSLSIIIVSFLFVVSSSSCSKDTTATVVKYDTVSVTNTDTLKTIFTDTSRLGLLTGKQWIFDSAFDNYTGAGTGSLVYARGANNNIIDLDTARFIFWADGKEDNFTSGGTYLSLTWSFVNGDSSRIFTPASPPYIPANDYATIVKLDATHFTLYDSTFTSLDVFIYKP
jgi:hypothetical protein